MLSKIFSIKFIHLKFIKDPDLVKIEMLEIHEILRVISKRVNKKRYFQMSQHSLSSNH